MIVILGDLNLFSAEKLTFKKINAVYDHVFAVFESKSEILPPIFFCENIFLTIIT